MDATIVLKRSDNTTFETVAEQAVLINMNTGTYFSLNKVGTEFWERLDGEQPIQAHAEAIAAKYTVDPAMVVDDLLELAANLRAEALVIAV